MKSSHEDAAKRHAHSAVQKKGSWPKRSNASKAKEKDCEREAKARMKRGSNGSEPEGLEIGLTLFEAPLTSRARTGRLTGRL